METIAYTVLQVRRHSYLIYSWWAYCKPLVIELYLEEVYFQTKTRVTIVFAGRVRKVSHSRGKQVQVGTVRASLGGVNEKIALDTGRQSIHQPGSNYNYTLPLQHMQSFPSLPPSADVASSISYVPICTASPKSQDATLDSLLVVGICFLIF